jgi:hypothetical protein
MHALTEIAPKLDLLLLTLFAGQGVGDRYWSRLKPSFATGPALLSIAVTGRWPSARAEHDAVRGAMYALPADGETAELSAPVIASRHKADAGLACALWKTTLEGLASRRMRRLRYGLEANSRYLANWLTRAGFGFVHPTQQGLVLEAEIAVLLEKTGLHRLSVDELLGTAFGTSPEHEGAAHFITMMRSLGNAFPLPRLVAVNPAAPLRPPRT